MRLLFKILLPLVVVGASFLAARHIIANKPEPQRRAAPSSITTVEAMRLTPSDYPIRVKAHGTVRPRTESTLLPEVSGRIVEVSPNFREGGFFEQGDVLLQIDPQDYATLVEHCRDECLGGAALRTWLEARRMELAEQMLRDRSRSIASIATLTGFANHSGFSRAFHRWKGMTPRQFRAQAGRAALAAESVGEIRNRFE